MGITHLVDKSVLGQVHRPEIRTAFRERLDAGMLAISTVTLLEQRVSDRSPEDSRRFDRLVLSKVQLLPTEAADVDRAREVQTQLLASGHHRGPSIPDLLVAAVAERHGLVVLHIDGDFETIAAVTHQPEQRIAHLPSPPAAPARPPRGTGIIMRRGESAGGGYSPYVVCAGCRQLVTDATGGRTLFHTPRVDVEQLEGRLAFAHTRCASSHPIAEYRETVPMVSWLTDLCRAVGVPETAPGVFDTTVTH